MTPEPHVPGPTDSSDPRRREAAQPDEPRPGFTAVGRVLRPHGTRGEIRVQPFSASALNLAQGRFVFALGARRRIVSSRPDRGALVLALGGIRDRPAADELRDSLLEAPDAEVERDDEDSYFVHELVGLRVLTGDGDEVGILAEVLSPGGADVYVVRGTSGEVLLPAVGDVIREIDVGRGIMVVAIPDGLVDESR